jgi:transcriptional regulator GlxA family with amidase domain
LGLSPHTISASSLSCPAYQTRINAARTLLETTDKLLTDIAAETGFYDHAHFVKTFKRIVGTTPSRYRKQHWQGQS